MQPNERCAASREFQKQKATLVATRREVEQGWYAIHDVLER
jgi:hypothetical protein